MYTNYYVSEKICAVFGKKMLSTKLNLNFGVEFDVHFRYLKGQFRIQILECNGKPRHSFFNQVAIGNLKINVNNFRRAMINSVQNRYGGKIIARGKLNYFQKH